jgi:hypothetical protein
MGREIRRVPKGWEHPVNKECKHYSGQPGHDRYRKPGSYIYGKCFIPMFDKDYPTAVAEWKKGFFEWEAGTHPSKKDNDCEFWEYNGSPPDPDSYRPVFESEPTCYQVYETVSEGTPVSPVFEDKEQIVQWLISEGHTETNARAFVEDEWAPSFVVCNGQAAAGIDAFDMMK